MVKPKTESSYLFWTGTVSTRTSRQQWLKIAAAALAIAVVALATVVAYRWHRPQRPQGQEALNAVPFTTLPGQETAPAFSPDDSRIAFHHPARWTPQPQAVHNDLDFEL